MMHRAKYLALALAATGALSGCGGGGSDTTVQPTAVFDAVEFYGTWNNAVGTCVQESAAWAGGRYYKNGSTVLSVSATSFENKGIYFSDANCSVKAGVVTILGTAKWSAGSASGRSNVARLVISSTGSQLSADGGTGLQLSGVPPTGVVQMYLMDVADGKLCTGANTKTADRDGYPTAIDSTGCLSR